MYGILRTCVPNSPLFQHCQVYDWSPFFNKKYMNGPVFSGFPMRAPFFWHPGICTYFSLRDFSRLLILLVLHELTDICVTTSKNGYKKKIKGQFMNRSTFWMIKYMNGSVFSKAKYMNGVGFEILARTPVPKLPLSYRPPLPPHPPPPTHPPQKSPIGEVWGCFLQKF